MSVSDIRHAQPAEGDSARLAVELKAALDDMPIEQQQAVRDRLVDVAVHLQTTGEVDPALHFLRSLQMTARLHRNPAYRKSLEEAMREPVGANTVSVTDFVARMKERHAR